MACVVLPSLLSAAQAQDPLRVPEGELACNAVCRWWMALGKPYDEPAPPERGSADPAPPVKALLQGDAPLRPQPVGLERPRPIHDRAAVPRRERPAPAALPTRLASDPPPRSLWGVPLPGSTPILPAAFARR